MVPWSTFAFLKGHGYPHLITTTTFYTNAMNRCSLYLYFVVNINAVNISWVVLGGGKRISCTKFLGINVCRI